MKQQETLITISVYNQITGATQRERGETGVEEIQEGTDDAARDGRIGVQRRRHGHNGEK